MTIIRKYLPMPIKKSFGPFLKIHIAVFLFGFTAILGKFIQFNQLELVWHRLWIGVLGLLVIPKVIRGVFKIPKGTMMVYAGIGVIVCLHWVAFFGSIKLGNASIALSCMATTTLFIAFLEPIITKSKFNWVEMILGLLVIIGIVLILNVGAVFYSSILTGLIAAFLAALFSTFNKKYIGSNNSMSVSAIELASGFIFLTLIFGVFKETSFQSLSLFRSDLVSDYALFGYNIHSFWYLIVLGFLCTSIAYALALSSLKNISAFSAGLAVNLEPIYGVAMAILIFHENEDLNLSFYIGTSLILLSVFIHPVALKWMSKRQSRLLQSISK